MTDAPHPNADGPRTGLGDDSRLARYDNLLD